jgi:hypothetical protein
MAQTSFKKGRKGSFRDLNFAGFASIVEAKAAKVGLPGRDNPCLTRLV